MSQSVNSNVVQVVEALLVQARAQIVKCLPRHLDADKMIYVALETVRADSFVRQCEPQNILQAVLEASQLGLMLGNKLGHAYLAPRRDKKINTLKCQLLIGYRGFIALAHRTGKVSSIHPAIVHQGAGPAALSSLDSSSALSWTGLSRTSCDDSVGLE